MMLRAFFVITFVIGACVMVLLGYQWIYDGIGLNPYVAFPMAGVMYFIPFYFLQKEADDLEVRLEDLLEYIDKGKDDEFHDIETMD